MKHCSVQVGVVALAMLSSFACATTRTAPGCGEAAVFEHMTQTYCVASSAITEEGFQCPNAYPYSHDFQDLGVRVCSHESMLPADLKAELDRTFTRVDAGPHDEAAVRDASNVDGNVTDATIGDASDASSSGNACNESDNSACQNSEVCVGDWACGLDAPCPGTCETCPQDLRGEAIRRNDSVVMKKISLKLVSGCGWEGQTHGMRFELVDDLGEVYTIADKIDDSNNHDFEVDPAYYKLEAFRESDQKSTLIELEVRSLQHGYSSRVDLYIPTLFDLLDVRIQGTVCSWGKLVC